MATYIRLTDYKDSDSKEQGFFKSENRYEAKQDDFEKIPGSPIAYWVSDRVKEIFDKSEQIAKLAEPRQGMATSDVNRFLRLWYEVSLEKCKYNSLNSEEAKKSYKKWFPTNKGGSFRKYYGNNEYLVNWLNSGEEVLGYAAQLYGSPTRTIKNINYYFKESLSWAMVSSGTFSARHNSSGFLFDVGGPSAFPKKDSILYVCAFFNSKLLQKLITIINPTLNYNSGDISKLPIIFPKQESTKQTIDSLTQECIDISKEEWDSRETSWDFTASPLIKNGKLRIENGKIEDAYNAYCNYWREKFYKLHSNEEELNRLFIDIYELQDELTPEVELKDITILKQESKINANNELEFNPQEIMKQFISYAVGIMFGRYSLDVDGLVVANLNQDYPKDATFEIDDDNIIPVLEDDYFTDDIASRFTNFVKVVFGEESLIENIDFIEKSLGTTIRKYFVKGFYEDHIKRYKKRPIYWMVSSPKKGFNILIYMHRYRSDIFATIQNDYLREYITKLESNIENLQRIADDESNSNSERNKASKEITKSNKVLDEIIQFDRNALTRFAQDGIDIDLDDGVKVNYCKFKDVLYPITGLCK